MSQFIKGQEQQDEPVGRRTRARTISVDVLEEKYNGTNDIDEVVGDFDKLLIDKEENEFGSEFSIEKLDEYVSICFNIEKEKLLLPFDETGNPEIILNFPFKQFRSEHRFEVEDYNFIVRKIRRAYDKKYGKRAFKIKFGEDVSYILYEDGEDDLGDCDDEGWIHPYEDNYETPEPSDEEQLLTQVQEVVNTFLKYSIDWSGGDDQLNINVNSFITAITYSNDTNTEVLVIKQIENSFTEEFINLFKPILIDTVNQIIYHNNKYLVFTNFTSTAFRQEDIDDLLNIMSLNPNLNADKEWYYWDNGHQQLQEEELGVQYGALGLVRNSGNYTDSRWSFDFEGNYGLDNFEELLVENKKLLKGKYSPLPFIPNPLQKLKCFKNRGGFEEGWLWDYLRYHQFDKAEQLTNPEQLTSDYYDITYTNSLLWAVHHTFDFLNGEAINWLITNGCKVDKKAFDLLLKFTNEALRTIDKKFLQTRHNYIESEKLDELKAREEETYEFLKPILVKFFHDYNITDDDECFEELLVIYFFIVDYEKAYGKNSLKRRFDEVTTTYKEERRFKLESCYNETCGECNDDVPRGCLKECCMAVCFECKCSC